MFRRQPRRLLTFAELTLVGEAGTIVEPEAELHAQIPDLAVVDFILPSVERIEGIARFKALVPDLRVILVSVIQAHVKLIRVATVEAGAEDFLLREDPAPELVRSWKV